MTKLPEVPVVDAPVAPVAPAARSDVAHGPAPATAPVPAPSLPRTRSSASTARFAAEARVSGQHPRLRTSVFARLESRATPFTSFDQLPSDAEGAARTGLTSRFLRTVTVLEHELPYQCAPRRPQAVGTLPRLLADFPQAPIRNISDVLLVSDWSSGANARVCLGELSGGRPVAVKTYTVEEAGERLLADARSLLLLDRLGIGPCFHGVVRDGDTVSVVMDLVPGDFVGTSVTEQTFADVETIITRLQRARLTSLAECQAYRTPSGRLLLIDGDTLAERIGEEPREPPSSAHGGQTDLRIWQLVAADADIGIAYLAGLRTANADAHTGLSERLKHLAAIGNDHPWSDVVLAKYGELVSSSPRAT